MWPHCPTHPSLSASNRLAVLSSSLTHWKKLPPLPSLTSQPHQVLASEPIPFSDLQQVSHPSPHSCPPTLPYRRWGSGVGLVVCGLCSLPPSSSLRFISSLSPPLNLCSFPSVFPVHPCLSLWPPVPLHSPLSGPLILLPWFLDLTCLSVPLLPGPSVSGLQDSCLCLQCTFSDPCGRKRGAGCTVWDPMKTGILGRSSPLHPVSSPPCLPWPPASLRLIQYPNLLLITEKIVEEEESEARSLSK